MQMVNSEEPTLIVFVKIVEEPPIEESVFELHSRQRKVQVATGMEIVE